MNCYKCFRYSVNGRLHKSRRGQIIGQVFVYILAAVTFVLITLFGYQAIINFVENAENVEFLSFKNEIERSIKDVYTEYGAVRQQSYALPAMYREACLVNLEADFNDDQIAELCRHSALACTIVKDIRAEGGPAASRYGKFDQNVFLVPAAPYGIKLYRFSLCENECSGPGDAVPYLCAPVSGGQISLVLEGKGDHTEISLPVSN